MRYLVDKMPDKPTDCPFSQPCIMQTGGVTRPCNFAHILQPNIPTLVHA